MAQITHITAAQRRCLQSLSRLARRLCQDIDVCDMSQRPGRLFSRELCLMHRDMAGYRAVIGVISRKIEADGAGVTTLTGAIRHAALTDCGGPDGSLITARTIAGRSM